MLDRVKRCVAAQERQADRFRAEAEAERDLLAAIVRIARPALPSLVSKQGGIAGVEFRGVNLFPSAPIAPLFLDEQGRWKDGAGHELTDVEVLARVAPEDVLAALAKILDRQTEGREKSAKQARENVARLRKAIEVLEEGAKS
jgi:hypothetical protein